MRTTRASDGQTTSVHRRFRDFVDLHAGVSAALRGHHLLSSVPALPPKKFKLVRRRG